MIDRDNAYFTYTQDTLSSYKHLIMHCCDKYRHTPYLYFTFFLNSYSYQLDQYQVYTLYKTLCIQLHCGVIPTASTVLLLIVLGILIMGIEISQLQRKITINSQLKSHQIHRSLLQTDDKDASTSTCDTSRSCQDAWCLKVHNQSHYFMQIIDK